MAKKRDINRFRPGQMALSNAGHDRGKLYVILDIQGEILFLTDGAGKQWHSRKRKMFVMYAG